MRQLLACCGEWECDIRELLEHALLVQNPGGGRSTSYQFADQLAELDDVPN